MKKFPLIFLIFLLLIGILSACNKEVTKNEPVKKNNKEITLKQEMTIMTLGKPLKDNRLDNIPIKDKIIEGENFLILDEEAFLKEENAELIKKMLNENKFFGVYGYKMNPKELFEKHPKYEFPVYTFDSNKEFYYYFYGFAYSKELDKPVPVTVIGNFTKEEMDKKIADFLIKYKKEHGL